MDAKAKTPEPVKPIQIKEKEKEKESIYIFESKPLTKENVLRLLELEEKNLFEQWTAGSFANESYSVHKYTALSNMYLNFDRIHPPAIPVRSMIVPPISNTINVVSNVVSDVKEKVGLAKIIESSKAKLSVDVHAYDGNLMDVKIPKLNVSNDRKKAVFSWLEISIGELTEIKQNVRNECLKSLNAIKNDCGMQPNYDATNQMYACDLLYLVCGKLIYDYSKDTFNLLIEVLSEMQGGMCQSGRATRIFQVWSAIKK